MREYNIGISVIIPNYNGLELFPQTIPTIFEALAETKLENEIIIVDDCSTDDSVKYISENFPSIITIKNIKNSGFSKSVNIGVSHSSYQFVLILNSDVKLTKTFFTNQISHLSNPKVFGVMSKIIGWDNDKQQDGATYPILELFKIKTSTSYSYKHDDNQARFTTYLSGANMFIKKDIFYEIGEFDEIFSPYYSEDTELSIRAWRLGYLCIYEPKAICRHKISYTMKKSQKKKNVDIIYNRNKFILHELALTGISKLFWRLQLFIELIFRIITLNFRFIKSYILYIKMFGEINRSIHRFNTNSKKLKQNKSFTDVKNFILNSITDEIKVQKD